MEPRSTRFLAVALAKSKSSKPPKYKPRSREEIRKIMERRKALGGPVKVLKTRAERNIAFIEKHCMKLAPFQIEMLKDIYAVKPNGKLKHDRVLISAARKSGKSAFASFIGVLSTAGPEAVVHSPYDGGRQCIVVASSQDQCTAIFDSAEKCIKEDEELASKLEVTPSKWNIRHVERLNRFFALAANPRTLQGYRPDVFLVDELAQHKSGKVLASMDYAQSAVKQDPLGFILSTYSEYSTNPLGELINTVQREKKEGRMDNWSVHIFQADAADKPWKWSTIRKANPALGYFQSEEQVRKERDAAKKIPSRLPLWWAYRLNRPMGVEDQLVNISDWQQCANPDLKLDDFNGKECTIGCDLSTTNALTSIVLAFRKDDVPHVFGYNWLPEKRAEDMEERHYLPYRTWIESGEIRTTQGNTIDLEPLADFLHECCLRFDVKEVRIDIHRSLVFKDLCEKKKYEIPFKLFRQTPLFLGPATEHFVNLVQSHTLVHSDNPPTNACVHNTIAKTSKSGPSNFIVPGRPGTGLNELPNDACVAMIEALAVMEKPKEEEKPKLWFGTPEEILNGEEHVVA